MLAANTPRTLLKAAGEYCRDQVRAIFPFLIFHFPELIIIFLFLYFLVIIFGSWFLKWMKTIWCHKTNPCPEATDSTSDKKGTLCTCVATRYPREWISGCLAGCPRVLWWTSSPGQEVLPRAQNQLWQESQRAFLSKKTNLWSVLWNNKQEEVCLFIFNLAWWEPSLRT